ncbi:MAG: hypothetical protein ABFD76_11555, partial [Smithella sp.]
KIVIGFLTVLISAMMGIFGYLISGKRREEYLRKTIEENEKRMRDALAKNDTVRISLLERELKRLRRELKRITAK